MDRSRTERIDLCQTACKVSHADPTSAVDDVVAAAAL